jgi:DNA-directed RNA polymerase I subunit RPA12
VLEPISIVADQNLFPVLHSIKTRRDISCRYPPLLRDLRQPPRTSNHLQEDNPVRSLRRLEQKYAFPVTYSCPTDTGKDKWPLSTQTFSKPDAFPSALQAKRSNVQAVNDDDIETWATVSKACPSCNHQTLLWRDMQLRGADEGTTIFYRCKECNYRYSDSITYGVWLTESRSKEDN